MGMGPAHLGRVASGRGFASERMALPQVQQGLQALGGGIAMVPGTLNLLLDLPFAGVLPFYVTEADLGGVIWSDHVPGRKGLSIGRALIAERYRGLVLRGDEPAYPANQVEIACEVRLRDTLGLADGARLDFRLVDSFR
jgi:CTP-dependent riboflavin kinase